MEQQPNNDRLQLGQLKKIQKILSQGGLNDNQLIYQQFLEKILLTCLVYKFNWKAKKQQRHFMITNYAVYNISFDNLFTSVIAKTFSSKFIIKRRIDLENITSISRNIQNSLEFVIHVPHEFDYRLMTNSTSLTNLLIGTIVKAHLEGKEQIFDYEEKFKFFFHDKVNLQSVQTTKKDLKQNLSKIPTWGQIFMSLKELQQYHRKASQIEEEKEDHFDNFLSQTEQKTSSMEEKVNKQQNKAKQSGPNLKSYQKLKTRLEVMEEEKEQYKGILKKTKDKKELISIDDFNLLKVIGRGGMAIIYLVEKKYTGELYAIKSMFKQKLIKYNQEQGFLTEGFILQNIVHPFICSTDYLFQTKDRICFLQKFYRGGDLFEHLRRNKRFTEKQTKIFAAQILLAIAHLHENDIIYRDCKPENFCFDEDGNLTILDFNMSKQLKGQLTANEITGTPEYISPEMLSMKPYGKQIDWWAYGTLMLVNKLVLTFYRYEMLIGIPPFYSQNQQNMFRMIKSQKLRFVKSINITSEAKDIITKLLIKDPSKRLGAKGPEEIKQHPWFKDINWDDIYNKKVKSPYIPYLKTQDCTDYFDNDFTNESVSWDAPPNDQISQTALRKLEKQFLHFDYDRNEYKIIKIVNNIYKKNNNTTDDLFKIR